jgi:hypothetical protein
MHNWLQNLTEHFRLRRQLFPILAVFECAHIYLFYLISVF